MAMPIPAKLQYTNIILEQPLGTNWEVIFMVMTQVTVVGIVFRLTAVVIL